MHSPSQTIAIHTYPSPFSLLHWHQKPLFLNASSRYQSISSVAYPLSNFQNPLVYPFVNLTFLNSFNMVTESPKSNLINPFIQPLPHTTQPSITHAFVIHKAFNHPLAPAIFLPLSAFLQHSFCTICPNPLTQIPRSSITNHRQWPHLPTFPPWRKPLSYSHLNSSSVNILCLLQQR